MKTSDEGIQEIRESEGERLVAYQDGGGVWTIGVGHTKGVKKGDKITPEQSLEFLKEDVQDAEEVIDQLVKVPLNQNMFDALASFVFNIGGPQFAKSTMLKLLNRGLYKDAAGEFEKWCYDNGKREHGLYLRRLREADWFDNPY